MPYVDKEENCGLFFLFVGVESNRRLGVTTQIVTPVGKCSGKDRERLSSSCQPRKLADRENCHGSFSRAARRKIHPATS